jgi:hypothetical protein
MKVIVAQPLNDTEADTDEEDTDEEDTDEEDTDEEDTDEADTPEADTTGADTTGADTTEAEAEFHIYQGLLTHYSNYFRTAVKKEWGGAAGTITVIDDPVSNLFVRTACETLLTSYFNV